MKHLRAAMLALVVCATVSSCERKHCWTCTYIYSLDSGRWNKAIVCDKTKSQIEEYEKSYGSKVRPVYDVRCKIK